MNTAEIKKIAESLTGEEKTVIEILGRYEDKDISKHGIYANEFNKKAGKQIQQPDSIIQDLFQKGFIELYNKEQRFENWPGKRNKKWFSRQDVEKAIAGLRKKSWIK